MYGTAVDRSQVGDARTRRESRFDRTDTGSMSVTRAQQISAEMGGARPACKKVFALQQNMLHMAPPALIRVGAVANRQHFATTLHAHVTIVQDARFRAEIRLADGQSAALHMHKAADFRRVQVTRPHRSAS